MAIKRKSSKLFDPHCLDELGVDIRNLQVDSRRIQPGDTFLAYAGEKQDGRHFISQAIAAGANAILWDPQDFSWEPLWVVPSLAIQDLKAKAGEIASHVYGQPSQKLWTIGITGTNGKTSCSHWYAQAMNELQKKTAIIGTLGNGFVSALEPASNTTPDATVLQQALASYVQQGAENVVMEVSSHGIVQGRVNGTTFSVAVLTNLSRDHLDYHRDMDAYAAAKARLFFWPGLKFAVVNMDDVLGVELSRQLASKSTRIIGYGFHYPELGCYSKHFSMVYGFNLRASVDGVEFDVEFEGHVAHLQVNVLGKFNAYNLLAVLAALVASNIPLVDAACALQSVHAIPGRMEKHVTARQPMIIVDYAHTPDALEKVLNSLQDILRSTTWDQVNLPRLHCVIGCGGDRDRGKRAMIGEVATRLADTAIFTSDNPRSEDPLRIISDMTASAHGQRYQVEVDRALAIYQAIDNAQVGDIVLVAGKGHEKYQEIQGKKIPFDDNEVVRQVLHDLASQSRVRS